MKSFSKRLLFLFALTVICHNLWSQNSLVGKIIDKADNQPLIGATLLFDGTTIGASTDFDGNFSIENVPNGVYNATISYVGYKSIKERINLSGGQKLTLSYALAPDTRILEGVIVIGKVEKQTITALSQLQQKSVGMLTGITGSEIRKSPDRTTGDVLKRVSGTSVQENKFVVIRGLADRYNSTMMNGQSLPSTEPDRKAFSFDLFPANLLSNLIVFKTAAPDLPGEFAGGIIQVNTKEIPEYSFVSLTYGAGFNSQSTFKNYNFYQTGNKDWLGYDDGTRAVPAGISKEKLSNIETQYETTKLFKNDWGINSFSSMMPTQSFQLSAGTNLKINENNVGIVGALTYNNIQRISNNEVSDFDADGTQLYKFKDTEYKKIASVGGLLNFAYQISNNSKLLLNNIMTVTGDDQYIERFGENYENTLFNKSYSMLYNSTALMSSQLLGEHGFFDNGTKLKWGVTYNQIARNTPSYRRMTYTKNFDSEPEEPYFAYVPSSNAPSPNYAGRFSSKQMEHFYTANVDFSTPYLKKDLLKMGLFVENRNRSFDAQNLGFVVSKINASTLELEKQSIGEIFAPQNIRQHGFVMRDATNLNDSYTASSLQTGGYLMTDYMIGSKLHLVGGLRLELFNQKLNSFTFGGKPINIDRNNTDWLPSLNVTYNLNEQSNLRFSASKTVSRPNAREIAPFNFYDFRTQRTILGNPDIVRTQISNLDLKYEVFANQNQSFSVTGFYKYFQSPIEQILDASGAGSKNITFNNVTSANNYGLELEFRHKLSFIGKLFENWAFFGNFSYISSMVNLSNVVGQTSTRRPLQGQSPYLINSGLSYSSPKSGFDATLLVNRIGRRIWLVGGNGDPDTYEAPRTLLDFQLTQRLFKNAELKLNVQDILNQTAYFYQDRNENGKYDAGGQDTKILSSVFGRNISFAFSYKF